GTRSDAFLRAVHRGMRRPLDIRCCPCPQLGRDEGLLLTLLGALQEGDTLSALEVLADWLEQPAVMPALTLATRLAAAAGECDLCIHWSALPPPQAGPCHGSPGHSTVH
ncbi:hypothetical protein, partial [Paracraurococcus lichenis]|nr:hypothetical protein [Paracraurococcus sp. LOR1-02]